MNAQLISNRTINSFKYINKLLIELDGRIIKIDWLTITQLTLMLIKFKGKVCLSVYYMTLQPTSDHIVNSFKYINKLSLEPDGRIVITDRLTITQLILMLIKLKGKICLLTIELQLGHH